MPKSIRKPLRKARDNLKSHPYSSSSSVLNYDDVVDDNNNNTTEISNSLSRGQRKRQANKDRILRKLGKISPNLPNNKYNNNNNNNSINDSAFLLSELEATLTSSVMKDLVKPAATSINTNKMKKVVAIREAERIKLVQQHPMFIQDPINAVKNHIKQMIEKKEEYNKKIMAIKK